MKKISVILFLITIVCMTSCKKEGNVSFGTVEYYPNFAWVDSKTTPVTKTFDFDFSQDAKDDNSYAELQFVDNEGKPISTNVMQVKIDGKEIADNKFRVNSDETSKDLTFTFSPNAEDGKYQGYLKLISHKLDRLDSQPLTPGQQVEAFQWTLKYEKRMNPLTKAIMWFLIVLLALFIIWFFLLRPIVYPTFGSIQKTFNVPKMAPLIVKFKGARMVVLAASHPKKQGRVKSFLKGKIIYKTHPAFVSPIIFKPTRGRKVLARVQAGTYQVLPNPMPGIGSASIIDIKKNLKINVN